MEDVMEDQIKIGNKTYNIIEQSGRRYLDPDQIIFLKKQIPLEIQKDPIIKKLTEHKFDTSGNEREKFRKVVEAFVDMHKKDGKWVSEGNPQLKKSGERDSFASWGFGNRNNTDRFLYVGEDAGLYDKKTQKAVKAPPQPKTVRASKLVKKIEDFEEHPLVKKWLNSDDFSDAGTEDAMKLFQALIILNLSPEELKEGGGYEDDADRLQWLKDRMKQETFTDVSGKKWKFGEIDKKGNKSGWVFETGKEFGNVENFGKGAGTALKTEQGLKFHDPRHQDFKKGGDGVRKIMTKMIRHFLVVNGTNVPDQKKNTILAQIVQEARHGEIHMTAEEILEMVRCVQQTKFKVNKIYDDVYKKEFDISKEDWLDAEMYFIIGLSVGWRRQEAFTAVAKRLAPDITDESGIVIDDKKDKFMVWIYTRKTERIGKAYWGGYVLSRDLGTIAQKLIREKLERVERKDPKEKLYSEVWENPRTQQQETYDMHPLIGTDGKYISVGTMHLPKKHKLTAKQRKEYDEKPFSKYSTYGMAKENSQNIKKLMAILRYCYKKVGKTETYWYKDSLHAVRHAFAQMWLKKSNRDLAWVKDWGHWGGVDVLEKHYGKQTDEDKIDAGNMYAERKLSDIAQQEKEKRETAKSKKEAEEQEMRFKLGFGESSRETKEESEQEEESEEEDELQ
jgi:hypothetical protein